MVNMNAKMKMRHYVIFSKPRKFNTANIKCLIYKWHINNILFLAKGKFGFLWRSGPEVIKLFSCSTQLSMKFSPLIDVKMPTIVGILTYICGKNNILGLTEP